MLLPLGEADAAKAKLKKTRIDRVSSILSRAEKLLLAAQDSEKRGDLAMGKLLRKRSCQKAILAAKIMGPLIVIAGMDLNEPATRARSIFLMAKSNGVKNA